MNKIKTCLFLAVFIIPGSLSAMQTMRYADVKLTYTEDSQTDFAWERAKKVSPKYPVALAREGIAGCGIFKISVDEDGQAFVLETNSYLPAKAVRKESIKLIENWEWKPVNGATNNEATVRIDFCMGGSSVEEAQQLCTPQSMLSCSE